MPRPLTPKQFISKRAQNHPGDRWKSISKRPQIEEMFLSIKTLALNNTFRTGPWGWVVTHSQPGRGRAAGRTRKHARCSNEGPPELPLTAQGVQSHHNFQSLSKSIVPLLKKQKNKASLVMGLQCSLTGDGPAESGPLLLGLHLLPRRQLLQLQRKASA